MIRHTANGIYNKRAVEGIDIVCDILALLLYLKLPFFFVERIMNRINRDPCNLLTIIIIIAAFFEEKLNAFNLKKKKNRSQLFCLPVRVVDNY